MRKAVQATMQILLLGLFIFLFLHGKVQLWMFLVLAGILLSFFLGRVYCGWICPINTVLHIITGIRKKLHLRSFAVPKAVAKPWLRYVVLGVFAGIFVFTMLSGKKLPVLPALFAIGVILTLFFDEAFWHRFLCPYGTIMRFPAAKSFFSMHIDEALCVDCGACPRVCPTSAIELKDECNEINKAECLICFKCTEICKKGAVRYGKGKKKAFPAPDETNNSADVSIGLKN
jgi:ferredoxin-type protein NapH